MSKLERHGWQAHEWHTVTDSRGRIQGKFKSPSPMLREEIEIVKAFLIEINKRKDDPTMAQQKQEQERTNMVFLAGVLKFDPKVYDNNVTCLIDVGMKASVQVAIFTGENAPTGNHTLAEKLKRYQEGDFIQVRAMLRPYGVKKGDVWKNSISVDVTEIKNNPPQRQREPERQRERSDDDIPF